MTAMTCQSLCKACKVFDSCKLGMKTEVPQRILYGRSVIVCESWEPITRDHIAQLEAQRGGAVVVAEEVYPGQREHVAFLGALKYELENPTPSQAPTSFDINRDYFEYYANAFSKDNERMAHGVGFMNGASWHREHYGISANRVLADGMVGVDREGLQDVYEALAYSQPSEPSVDPHSNSIAHRRALGFCADALRSTKGEVEG